jgi:hypothetical protein
MDCGTLSENAVCRRDDEFIHIITEFTEVNDGSRFQKFSTGSESDTGRQTVKNDIGELKAQDGLVTHVIVRGPRDNVH